MGHAGRGSSTAAVRQFRATRHLARSSHAAAPASLLRCPVSTACLLSHITAPSQEHLEVPEKCRTCLLLQLPNCCLARCLIAVHEAGRQLRTVWLGRVGVSVRRGVKVSCGSAAAVSLAAALPVAAATAGSTTSVLRRQHQPPPPQVLEQTRAAGAPPGSSFQWAAGTASAQAAPAAGPCAGSTGRAMAFFQCNMQVMVGQGAASGSGRCRSAAGKQAGLRDRPAGQLAARRSTAYTTHQLQLTSAMLMPKDCNMRKGCSLIRRCTVRAHPPLPQWPRRRWRPAASTAPRTPTAAGGRADPPTAD